MFTLPPRRWRTNSTRVYSLLELEHLLVGQAIHLLLDLLRERLRAQRVTVRLTPRHGRVPVQLTLLLFCPEQL